MLKYAFLINSKTLTPETYSREFVGKNFHGYICAVNSFKKACEIAGKLADEGFQEIDLCGDYGLEKAKVIKDSLGSRVKIFYEIYEDGEEDKFEALSSLNPWGVIINVGETWERDRYFLLQSSEFDTHVACVKDLEEALQAARQMQKNGVAFIELCGYFDKEKRDQIISAIEGKMPVGYPVKV